MLYRTFVWNVITLGHTGVFMGGKINFGYSNIDRKWVINKEESKWVKKIFSMYLQGSSLVEIKELLDTNGVSPRRSKVWNIGTLLTMLKNRVYIGEYTWKLKDPHDKEQILEVFNITTPQIISHSMFNRVQKMVNKNQKNKGNNSRKYESLLSDLLVCYCGENITGVVKTTLNKNGYKSYGCRSNENKRSAGVSRYTTKKNRKNTPERLEIKKFCTHCNRHTNHKEIK